MGRAPCCEKMGLKKGPWIPEEDQVLVSYIQKHGHGNWRALPKQAGLLRCGKSCRLRWTNYLRPDIKRGNFTTEEEETIIKLHEMLGNRWSAIASRLPGRTDNEIKNVWHTHLKKRLKNYQTSQETKRHYTINVQKSDPKATTKVDHNNQVDIPNLSSGIHRNINCAPVSPQPSSSEISTVTDSAVMEGNIFIKQEEMDSLEYIPQIDESFWSEDLSADSGNIAQEDQFHHGVTTNEVQFKLPLSTMAAASSTHEHVNGDTANLDDIMNFWYDLFIRGADLPKLPEF